MPIPKTCYRCAAPFMVSPGHEMKRRFCSPACREALEAERRVWCPMCGAALPTPRIGSAKPQKKFCSTRCRGLAQRIPVKDRFWKYVRKTDGCWLWTGTFHEHGYGRIKNSVADGPRQDLYAHRLAWEEAAGRSLADGEDVCHTCDIPACVRNDEAGTYVVDGRTFVRYGHLFAATNLDNWADRDAKDRVRHGGRHTHAKLTEADVAKMRALYATGQISYSRLGAAFSVSSATAYEAVKGITWKRVP